jgi:hypothetical protein
MDYAHGTIAGTDAGFSPQVSRQEADLGSVNLFGWSQCSLIPPLPSSGRPTHCSAKLYLLPLDASQLPNHQKSLSL